MCRRAPRPPCIRHLSLSVAAARRRGRWPTPAPRPGARRSSRPRPGERNDADRRRRLGRGACSSAMRARRSASGCGASRSRPARRCAIPTAIRASPTAAACASSLGDGDDRAIVRWLPGTGVHPGRDHGHRRPRRRPPARARRTGLLRFEGGDGDDTLVTGAAAGRVPPRGRRRRPHGVQRSSAASIAGYDDHDAAGVRVTLDRTANDGARGRARRRPHERRVGSPGPDVIAGDERANTLTGSGGPDVIERRRAATTQIDATAAGRPERADGRTP